jgi:hypothetical protein
VLGAFISGLVVIGMARAGARYHVGYPVLARASMGMYGSFFFVFIRAIIGTIAFGIQTFYGANLLSTCLRCIFGSLWENMYNHLPASAHVTSKFLLCFFIVWLVQFPLVRRRCTTRLPPFIADESWEKLVFRSPVKDSHHLYRQGRSGPHCHIWNLWLVHDERCRSVYY